MNTTTKAAHTPGPWEVAFYGDFNGRPALVRAICSGLMIQVDTSEQWRDPRPDANVIAAAPEMLEVLEYTLNRTACGCHSVTTEEWHSDKCHIPKVRRVIQKARGGQ